MAARSGTTARSMLLIGMDGSRDGQEKVFYAIVLGIALTVLILHIIV
jgi:hypothetical protein